MNLAELKRLLDRGRQSHVPRDQQRALGWMISVRALRQPNRNDVALAADSAMIGVVDPRGFGVKDPQPALWGLHDAFSPFKEYVIARNDKDTDELVQPAKRLLAFRQGNAGRLRPMAPSVCNGHVTDM